MHKLIIGDNYDALQQLLITHKGLIDVIYIDPPYGCDSMGDFANTNYDNSVSRDNLLSMLYPRLFIARQLLSESGIIFCSIDDKNQAYLKCMFDDIFREENFLMNFCWQKTAGAKNATKYISSNHEYILCYAKSINYCEIYGDERSELAMKDYKNPDNDPRGVWSRTSMLAPGFNPKNRFEMVFANGMTYMPGDGKSWRYSKEKMLELEAEGRISFEPKMPRKKTYLSEVDLVPPKSLILQDVGGNNQQGTTEMELIFGNKSLFLFPKPKKLIKYLISKHPNKNATVLDFFAGSGTTGQAVLELNKEDGGTRQFIVCTNNEITGINPNGIAYDVTAKRLRRVMCGKCYDGVSDFKWLEKNKPYGGNLDVYDIETVNSTEQKEGKSPFDVIDEMCYDMPKFTSVQEKIAWICGNFENTQKYLKEEE